MLKEFLKKSLFYDVMKGCFSGGHGDTCEVNYVRI